MTITDERQHVTEADVRCWCLPVFIVERHGTVIIHRYERVDIDV